MAPRKGKRGKEERAPGTSGGWDPFLVVGLLTHADMLKPGRRARRMAKMLERMVDGMIENGAVPAPWIVYPLVCFRDAVQAGQENVPPEVVLAAIDCFVGKAPDELRASGRRFALHFFGGKLEEIGVEPPEWLRLGWKLWGRWGDFPGEGTHEHDH